DHRGVLRLDFRHQREGPALHRAEGAAAHAGWRLDHPERLHRGQQRPAGEQRLCRHQSRGAFVRAHLDDGPERPPHPRERHQPRLDRYARPEQLAGVLRCRRATPQGHRQRRSPRQDRHAGRDREGGGVPRLRRRELRHRRRAVRRRRLRAGMTMDPRTRALLEAPIAPTLLRLAVPNMLVLVAQAAAGLIETYFIGKLGTDALAGVALVFPVGLLMQMLWAGVVGGAVHVWPFTSLASVIRGAGKMALPAVVTCVGVVILVPLSPALIFGWGPFPALGIAGGAVALVFYYALGCLALAAYLWSGRSVVRPSLRTVRFRWPLFLAVLPVLAV